MNNAIASSWAGLSRGGRIAAGGVGVLFLALVVWGLFFAVRQEYGVLFSDLAQSDAGTIIEELKRQKTPYRLTDGGATIMVPMDQVHEVRLGLMTSDLPLSGGVGFEIFDKQSMGATEHSQKVSYQRALQGELSRTIGSLENVKQVRVHLVLPESTLFTRDRQEASAAVTVSMEPGTALQRQQIVGVQRLVAASVGGLDPARVVITDQRGVTLSSADAAGVGAGAAEARLEVKRQVEEYISHKIARLLDSAFGPGQAIVSVDASLNFDATKTTIQDLLPAAGSLDGAEGRVVRRRQVISSSSSDSLWTATGDGIAQPRQPGSSTEVEYEYGRRLEEVIAAPGAVTRISVGVIVPGDAPEERRERIADLVRMAGGINERRGDAISVQTLGQLGTNVVPPNETVQIEAGKDEEVQTQSRDRVSTSIDATDWRLYGGAAALLAVLVLLAVRLRSAGSPRELTPEDRQRILEEIQRTLGEDSKLAGRTRS